MDAEVRLPSAFTALIDVWSRPQITLPKVVRWSKYVKRGTRRQDTLQHTFSGLLFVTWLIPRLRKHVRFKEYLVLHAFALHDVGEGEIGADTLYVDKTAAGDEAEATAFLSRYQDVLGSEAVTAYLLQFARKAEQMPMYKARLNEIACAFPTEALIFEAVERFDYLLYAFEQYLTRRKTKILVRILRNHWSRLEELADCIPGLRDVLWMDEIASWRAAFLARYEGKWIEQKGER